MDKFEITLDELEQLCTELGLELTKYDGQFFTIKEMFTFQYHLSPHKNLFPNRIFYLIYLET